MKRPFALVVLIAAAVLAAFAGPAAAKGPSKVTITGPGLTHPIVLTGNPESDGPGTPFESLVERSGWFGLVFRQSPDPTSPRRPAGALGPRYVAAYVVPMGTAPAGTIRQELYPFAAAGALAHVAAGQRIFGGDTHGGWYRGGLTLKRALVAVGIPGRRLP
ncbi:MAG: hypothetical protein ACM3QU_13015 [Verrucomicrobiota bacterium]